MTLYHKYTTQEEVAFESISFTKRGRQANFPNSLPQLYPHKHAISKEKMEDIQKLFKYTPLVHHKFLKYLWVKPDLSKAKIFLIQHIQPLNLMKMNLKN